MVVSLKGLINQPEEKTHIWIRKHAQILLLIFWKVDASKKPLSPTLPQITVDFKNKGAPLNTEYLSGLVKRLSWSACSSSAYIKRFDFEWLFYLESLICCQFLSTWFIVEYRLLFGIIHDSQKLELIQTSGLNSHVCTILFNKSKEYIVDTLYNIDNQKSWCWGQYCGKQVELQDAGLRSEFRFGVLATLSDPASSHCSWESDRWWGHTYVLASYGAIPMELQAFAVLIIRGIWRVNQWMKDLFLSVSPMLSVTLPAKQINILRKHTTYW